MHRTIYALFLSQLKLLPLILLIAFLPQLALAQDPTHLRVSGSGWNHLKLGSNSTNLWGPSVNPATGRTHLRLVLRNFGGVDWNKMLVAPQGDPAKGVVIGNHLAGLSGPWLDISIPLSAFPANAFNNISMLSMPFSNGNGNFELGIAQVEFTGGNNSGDVWFGAEQTTHVIETDWPTVLVPTTDTGDDSGGDNDAGDGGNTGGDNTGGGSASSTCESHIRISGAGGYSHFKIGNNANSLWNPSLSPASNQNTLRLRLQNFSATDWSKLMVVPNGNPANGVTLGNYVDNNASGWIDVDIPISAFPPGAMNSIANISVPFSNGANAFELGVSAISFTNGSAPLPVQWFGGTTGIDNVVESSWDFARVNGTENCDNGNGGGSDPGPTDQVTFGAFAGTNVFVDTPGEPIDVFGQVRIYMPAYFFGSNAASARDLAFNPADGFIANVDDTLRRISAASPDVMLTLEDNFPYLAATPWELPIPAGADGKDVASWAETREACFQISARYGSANPPGVSVRANNQPLTGQRLITRLMPRNEVHRWWEGEQRTFVRPDGVTETRTAADWAPEEVAAMMVACYEGAKAADPNMQVVWPGIVDEALIRRSKAWLDVINGGRMPADEFVINHYWSRVSADPNATYLDALDFTLVQGQHPEAFGGQQAFMVDKINLIQSLWPGLPVTIGEFGYDTGPSSWQRAPGTFNTSAEKQQSQWLVRSFLALKAAGIERAYQFSIRGSQDGLFQGSGLATDFYGARLGWYYVAGTVEVLKDAWYVRDVPSGQLNVTIHEYADASGRKIYPVWSPTANNSSVDGYRLSIDAGSTSAALVTLTEGERGGWNGEPFTENLAINVDNSVIIDVSETPVFVVVNP